ncbi:MAG: DUF1549 and DUF1553 domain-containing protein [Planctomycetota bacterium]
MLYSILASLLIDAAAQTGMSTWSMVPPVRPDVQGRGHPIDLLLGSQVPRVEVKPEAFVRRLSYDMRGLPPAAGDLADYLSWPKDERVSRIVDRYLDTPEFGQKQAQAWLDAVRFAETNGFEADAERHHAWRYRDWVIEAANLDLPYDRFLSLQIAGDLAEIRDIRTGHPSDNPIHALVATGFHRCGPSHMVSGNLDKKILRNEFLTEATTTIGSAILGLTLHCARCHDHKFDPITQEDYYRLQAFIARIEPIDTLISSPEELARTTTARAVIEARMASVRKSISQIDEPARAAAQKAKLANVPADARVAIETPQARRSPEQKALAERFMPAIKVAWDDVLAQLGASQRKSRAELKTKLVDLARQMPPPASQAWGVKEGEPVTHHLLKRGQPTAPGDPVKPGYPQVFGTVNKGGEPASRADLARWLSSPENPLTARVAVNRIWRQYFGKGLVQPEDDFGARSKPANQAVLDFLATELVRQKWSLKSIHRLLATSAAYRAREFPGMETRRRRLSAEEIRDTALAAAGELDPRMGGPGIRISLDQEVLDLIFTEGEPEGLWITPSRKEDENRRSIYLLAKRNVKVPLLESFDQPDLLNPCGKRPDSTHAPQTLALWNSPWTRKRAEAAAKKASMSAIRPIDAVSSLFLAILGRNPSTEELRLALESCKEDPKLNDLALALLNSNAFLYLD